MLSSILGQRGEGKESGRKGAARPSTYSGVGTEACTGLAGYNYAASTCSTWAMAVATKEKVNSRP